MRLVNDNFLFTFRPRAEICKYLIFKSEFFLSKLYFYIKAKHN